MKIHTKTLLCIFTVLLISQVNAFGDDPKEDLQNFFDGLFEQGNLTDPTTIVNCYDVNSTNLTLAFLGNLFSDLAYNNAVQGFADIEVYTSLLPSTVTTCLGHNQEFQNLTKAYNIAGKTLIQIGSDLITYGAGHYDQVHQTLVTLDYDYDDGQYEVSGKLFGQIIHQAIPNKSQNIAF